MVTRTIRRRGLADRNGNVPLAVSLRVGQAPGSVRRLEDGYSLRAAARHMVEIARASVEYRRATP
jgi:hypothetical protein